ncbi:MAG: protein kinase, partial [Polyangiaceae bacterium]|nr:protein kinase [Polyangiaceae bacterium]
MTEGPVQNRRERIASPPEGSLGWVGTYQLIKRLPYQGGPLEYVARQHGPLGFERICRAKLVPLPSDDGDRRNAEALAWEAMVVLRLDHPGIVRMYDFFKHNDTLVLVLEHFSGLSLAHLLDLLEKYKLAFDERLAWHVGHSLFMALAHAHGVAEPGGLREPVVHSDVRPSNLLVSADGRVRLAGFGCARQ